MKRLFTVVLAAVLLALPSATAAPVSADGCQFVLGFKAIHDAMPDIVGDCLVDEHNNPTNGDGLQETSGRNGAGGLMVWRKADNWTAYTDGYRTWINGPNGLQQRLNTERFAWENDGSGQSLAPTATPTETARPSADVVHPGAFCSPLGATGVTSTGPPMVCRDVPGETRARWRSP